MNTTDAVKLAIYIGDSDRHHGKPLHLAIVELLRAEGIAGATVLHGIEGYGPSRHIHTSRILDLSQDLPVILEVVETTERIEQMLPRLDGMVEGGLITLEKVQVLHYGTSVPAE